MLGLAYTLVYRVSGILYKKNGFYAFIRRCCNIFFKEEDLIKCMFYGNAVLKIPEIFCFSCIHYVGMKVFQIDRLLFPPFPLHTKIINNTGETATLKVRMF